MKYSGINDPEEILRFAENSRGCYVEYSFSASLHEFLTSKTKTFSFDKKTNTREYWLDIDKEQTAWRIILK
jgi:hypothetical protein